MANTTYLEFAKKLGADHILKKPFHRDQVLKMVSECLAMPA